MKGIAYMEIVRPRTWDTLGRLIPRPILQELRSEADEGMILRDNLFVERLLPRGVMRTLSGEEMAQYRRPSAEHGEGRRPTLTWAPQIPIEGEPADVAVASADRGDGRGVHFLQEDSPDEIGRAVAGWMLNL
jgi:haloalkane dehalogenase